MPLFPGAGHYLPSNTSYLKLFGGHTCSTVASGASMVIIPGKFLVNEFIMARTLPGRSGWSEDARAER